MFRSLLAGAFVACLVVGAGFAEDKKVEKKEPPKKKERIALNEPKDVAKDPDFAIQGEYAGNPEYKVGVQVVAKGLGEFDLKIFQGGLPGDGWDGKATTKATAKRNDDGGATIVGKDLTGSIAGKTLSLKSDGKESAMTKVERKSETIGKAPPEGAVVLFGKEGDEKNWDGGKIVELSDGKFLGVGVKSKQKFQGFTAHIEFRLPWMPNSTGQQRGNSGVYLQDRYECQVLDSFGLNGENNECGGIYTQHKPSVNMCYPPMSWQTYDIEFAPAQFGEDGKKAKNGRATIYHNGVKIHDNIEFPKECPGGQPEKAEAGPFQFQNHGDPVVYRNVWVLPAK
ncbi:MAG: DUF1080 domain-containing protein [Planctomycetes bacterium]|nr:DUF1080 domain-containing protein [Planctomycetota bacterium]